MTADEQTASGPFSRTTLWVITGVAALSLIVATVLVMIGSDPSSQRSAGADAYSRSAIGHRGLVELLRRLDIPVVVSRHGSASKGRSGLVVLAEPTAALSASELERLVAQPGITGWAQIRAPYSFDELGAEEKLSYDLWYLRHRSLALDTVICVKTVATLLTGAGAR